MSKKTQLIGNSDGMGLACSIRLPEIHLIYSWLLEEKGTPFIIHDAD
jgi:hypothetical protein